MRDDHAYVMQVKLYKANTRGVTPDASKKLPDAQISPNRLNFLDMQTSIIWSNPMR